MDIFTESHQARRYSLNATRRARLFHLYHRVPPPFRWNRRPMLNTASRSVVSHYEKGMLSYQRLLVRIGFCTSYQVRILSAIEESPRGMTPAFEILVSHFLHKACVQSAVVRSQRLPKTRRRATAPENSSRQNETSGNAVAPNVPN